MNKSLIPLVGVILATLLSGCAKNNDNKNNDPTANQQNQQPKAIDLSGKSLEEVLALKYNKAELSCAVWVQRNQKLDLTATPNDSFVLDLKADSKMPHTFKLAGQIQNHKIEAQIEVITESTT